MSCESRAAIYFLCVFSSLSTREKKRIKNLPLIGGGTVIGTENKQKMQFSYVFT
jgi:hypothetical protein